MKTEQFIAIEDKFGAHNYHPLDVVITQGQGHLGLGRRRPEIPRFPERLFGRQPGALPSPHHQGLAAPRLANVTLTSRAFRNDQWPLLAKELCQMTGYDMVLPMNSGAEAVETAIKTARKWGYQKKGIPARTRPRSSPARTTSTAGRSRSSAFRPSRSTGRTSDRSRPASRSSPSTMPKLSNRPSRPTPRRSSSSPIQAEAGILIPSPGYLKKAKDICDKHNVLFIADEIQTGLGRTGKLFAFEHEGFRPDMVVIGKSLGGGCYPISAVLAPSEILGVFKPGEHGSTFGGNPLACAVAREALRVIKDEKLVQNAAKQGRVFHVKGSRRSRAGISKRSAARASRSASSFTRRPAGRAGSAKRSRTPGCCARKRTKTSSASPRRSSSRKPTSTGHSSGSRASSRSSETERQMESLKQSGHRSPRLMTPRTAAISSRPAEPSAPGSILGGRTLSAFAGQDPAQTAARQKPAPPRPKTNIEDALKVPRTKYSLPGPISGAGRRNAAIRKRCRKASPTPPSSRPWFEKGLQALTGKDLKDSFGLFFTRNDSSGSRSIPVGPGLDQHPARNRRLPSSPG